MYAPSFNTCSLSMVPTLLHKLGKLPKIPCVGGCHPGGIAEYGHLNPAAR